jgi:hypothetical protein
MVGPQLPPASFSSNLFGTTMVSLTGGNTVNSGRSALINSGGGADETSLLGELVRFTGFFIGCACAEFG